MSIRIAGLIAENFKRLVAVDITPAGNVVQITGKNGNGKSSCLDAISVALEGLDVCPGEPIRKGEKKAQIRVRLTGDRELLVTRKFALKEDGGYTSALTVESLDGAQFKKPQQLLDELLGELAFDPLAFKHMKAKDQFNALRSFAPGVDFELVDAQNLADYNRRTDVNRQAREAAAAANQIVVPLDTPEEPIDEDALTDALKAAGVLNQDVERRRGLRARAQEDVATWRAQAQAKHDSIASEGNAVRERYIAQIRGIEQQISALQRQLETTRADADRAVVLAEQEIQIAADELVTKANELQARLDQAEQLPEIVDVDAIAVKIGTARNINANVERARQKAAHLATAQKYEAESKALTDAIEARTAAKDAAIAKAQMPVEGLGFGAGEVLLNGVPFAQASSAEQLRTSCAIAMAKNPKLRVCFIRDGSLLDEDNMRLIAEMAEQHQFQVFVEKVDSTGRVGFVIENGSLRDAAAAERSAA